MLGREKGNDLSILSRRYEAGASGSKVGRRSLESRVNGRRGLPRWLSAT